MGRTFLKINSEIGRLRAVLLHRPGKEIENLVPEYLERLLFDDIPYLKIAQQEHDIFANVLKSNGVNVFYIENLLKDIFIEDNLKTNFINIFLQESNIRNKELSVVLKEYLLSLNIDELTDMLIAGIREKDIKGNLHNKLPNMDNDIYLFYVDPMPNLYFTRDIGAAISNGFSISKMKTEARKRETLFLKYIYDNHKLFKDTDTPIWYDREMPNSLEGGDELVLNSHVIAIGCSERTSALAIDIFAKNLFRKGQFDKIIVFDIPKCRAFMHLDTVFTMVDFDKFTIHPGIEEPMSVYIITKDGQEDIRKSYEINTLESILKKELELSEIELIRCGGGDPIVAAREQWNDGSNTLAIAPGVVITYERNYVSNELLESYGIKVITIPSSELSRGRGGPRCMSMPLIREDIKN